MRLISDKIQCGHDDLLSLLDTVRGIKNTRFTFVDIHKGVNLSRIVGAQRRMQRAWLVVSNA